MPSIIKIHAGDFKANDVGTYSWGKLRLPVKGKFFSEKLDAKSISHIEIATEENVKKWGAAAGWGIAGAALLGPVGLLAGLLFGGKSKDITFVARFDDERQMLATTDPATYKILLAKAFK